MNSSEKKVLNSKTGRMVKRNGKIGKQIMNMKGGGPNPINIDIDIEKYKNSYLTVNHTLNNSINNALTNHAYRMGELKMNFYSLNVNKNKKFVVLNDNDIHAYVYLLFYRFDIDPNVTFDSDVEKLGIYITHTFMKYKNIFNYKYMNNFTRITFIKNYNDNTLILFSKIFNCPENNDYIFWPDTKICYESNQNLKNMFLIYFALKNAYNKGKKLINEMQINKYVFPEQENLKKYYLEKQKPNSQQNCIIS